MKCEAFHNFSFMILTKITTSEFSLLTSVEASPELSLTGLYQTLCKITENIKISSCINCLGKSKSNLLKQFQDTILFI